MTSNSSKVLNISVEQSFGESDSDLFTDIPRSASNRSLGSSFSIMTSSSPRNSNNKNKRVAVIGGGVSGLAAAYHLQESGTCAFVTVFEKAERLGGHAWTVPIHNNNNNNNKNANDDSVDVDIGFMVFNESNYPNMVQWFQRLNASTTTTTESSESSTDRNDGGAVVQAEASDMSLSVSLDGGQTVEWSSDGLSSLLTSWKQALSPTFYKFLWEMLRFNRTAAGILWLDDADPRKHVTTRDYLRQHQYSDAFATYYLYPMMAALWSASITDVRQFPAAQLIGFLCHHQMLQLFGRPDWKTVSGRSQSYVKAVQQVLLDNNKKNAAAAVHCHTAVHAIQKLDNGTYQLLDADGKALGGDDDGSGCCFDHVVFACHPPTAASILRQSSSNNMKDDDDETAVLTKLLNSIEYADNVVYVHSDETLMPKSQKAWASWNCIGKSDLMMMTSMMTKSKNNNKSNNASAAAASSGAFEGGESGFGNRHDDDDDDNEHGGHHQQQTAGEASSSEQLEGEDGRFKAVYVTYWLNRLQNLATADDQNIFVSLNPHSKPDPALTHQRVIMAHPQFNAATVAARSQLLQHHQGVDNLWFCGAWAGYGFHEDGCRSGFQVATALSGVPLPWVRSTTTNTTAEDDDESSSMMVLPPPDLARQTQFQSGLLGMWQKLYRKLSYDLPVAVCKRFIYYFLNRAVQKGTLRLHFNDGSTKSFGDGSPCGCDSREVTLRIFDPWFFVKTALEYDLGLARSYMAGYFVVEPLDDPSAYHPVIRPKGARDETTIAIGDPVGLTRLFLLLIGNRDFPPSKHVPKKSGRGHFYSGALTNASGLVIGKIGGLLNFVWYKLTMDNSERGGSLKNIHAHYNLSNTLFKLFLDKETLMYSSAIFDAVRVPSPQSGLVFRGTLEEAQWRKLDTLLDRAQVEPGQTLLDIGFGWGGLSLHAAKKYGCKVMGITLSIEQKSLAEKRVKEAGLESLISFEVVDYRTFARRKENQGKFDRVLSCEMIEAVGHKHLREFFWAVEQVLAHDGILVMEAITTPEARYETYIRSTDFINTIIFPGSCCPSLHALVDAAYQQSSLTLEHIDNIGLHYAQTLAEWRRRFNASEATVRSLGFDDVFLRAWNYYLTYCEAGFFSQTENCLILVFSRQGCTSLVPLCETRSVTQQPPLSIAETCNWLTDGMV